MNSMYGRTNYLQPNLDTLVMGILNGKQPHRCSFS
jgi:hypothetical protein